MIFPIPCFYSGSLSYNLSRITPTTIAGDSMNAITATICPLKLICCSYRNVTAETKVTALT
jgi:hypothetical protein